jgi:hypothetical protein
MLMILGSSTGFNSHNLNIRNGSSSDAINYGVLYLSVQMLLSFLEVAVESRGDLRIYFMCCNLQHATFCKIACPYQVYVPCSHFVRNHATFSSHLSFSRDCSSIYYMYLVHKGLV